KRLRVSWSRRRTRSATASAYSLPALLPQALLEQVAHRPELLLGNVAFRDQVRHELERRVLVDAAEDAVQRTLARGLGRDRRAIEVLAPFLPLRDRSLQLEQPELRLDGGVGDVIAECLPHVCHRRLAQLPQ